MKFIAFIIFLAANTLFAQRYTISGYVIDQKSGEKLIGASIYDTISKRGTITNAYGFFSLTLQEGDIVLVISYVGYSMHLELLNLKANVTKNYALKPTIELKEIEVVAQRENIHVESTQMSVTHIPVQTIKQLPVFFSETDILKTIQLLPGVQSGGEGTSGLYVRGGGPDQNLILLDGVPVYNCDHLFGFFSVFNTDAINNITLIKGGFPARYGGRISSVLDIRMKEGNLNEYKGNFSIGLISSKFTFEGPIKKEKSSFIVSGRRTYIDILSQPFIRSFSNDGSGGYFFYDFNSKVNYIFSDTNRLYLSFYIGNDKAYSRLKESYKENGVNYKIKEKANIGWGNIITAIRWNHLFSNKLFSNVTTTYSRYRFNVGMESINMGDNGSENNFSFNYFSGIHDFSTKIDFDYRPVSTHNINFGSAITHHTFSPGINVFRMTSSTEGNLDTTFGNKNIYAYDFYWFAEDDIDISALIKMNIGVHQSLFWLKNKYYAHFQPRASLRLLFHENWSTKLSYSQMNQYVHLLSNSGIGLPTDLWLPVTKNIKPQNSHQCALGLYTNVFKGYEASIETYYKTIDNVIEYKEGASFFSQTSSWEDKVTMGNAWAYGAEFFLRKNKGKTTGWIGYTLAWSWRKFDDLNFGRKFPYRYDRRHDISVVITHKFNEQYDVGLVWVYGTGNAVSLPIEQYPSEDPTLLNVLYTDTYSSIQYYYGRNGFRMPAYHRLDISLNMHKQLKRSKRTWSFGIYNLYNRKNPYYLYFSYDKRNQKRLTQISLFPIIPSFSYSLTF